MWIPSISSSCWRVRRGAGLELGATLLCSYPASLTLLESESWNATLYFHGGDSSLSDSLPALVISTLRVRDYCDLFIHLCLPSEVCSSVQKPCPLTEILLFPPLPSRRHKVEEGWPFLRLVPTPAPQAPGPGRGTHPSLIHTLRLQFPQG